MTTLICGSLAYDNIMIFQDRFRNHILPEQIHILNVSFLVPEMRRGYGGCAGNIAYNLKLIGGEPTIMAAVGSDGGDYLRYLDATGLDRTHVLTLDDQLTAQAFITTDMDDNQITAFHPGAMNFSHLNRVSDAKGVTLGIVAPDGRDGMIEHAREMNSLGIPFVFDPGQGLPMFSGDDILHFLDLADYACFNDYEVRLACDRTGLTTEALSDRLEALFITLGSEGSVVYSSGVICDIPCVTPDAVVDPTGCGDAYRAGLLYGIASGWDAEKSARLASVMGAIKIAHRGGQSHRVRRDEIAQRYAATFGEAPWGAEDRGQRTED
ncbi:MAG: carbohydrate kinase family protein [Candidatus Accumulibacter sp.]|jgi:adenosine kinase|nr:carbohydrate kinase family protein [Accumulibacter sp.]